MQAIGRTRWAIAEGYIPGASTGPAPAMTSHETVCILNTSDTDALFANGARLLLEPLGLRGRWRNEDVLRRIVVITLATAAPIGLFLLIGQPVSLLKIAGRSKRRTSPSSSSWCCS